MLVCRVINNYSLMSPIQKSRQCMCSKCKSPSHQDYSILQQHDLHLRRCFLFKPCLFSSHVFLNLVHLFFSLSFFLFKDLVVLRLQSRKDPATSQAQFRTGEKTKTRRSFSEKEKKKKSGEEGKVEKKTVKKKKISSNQS